MDTLAPKSQRTRVALLVAAAAALIAAAVGVGFVARYYGFGAAEPAGEGGLPFSPLEAPASILRQIGQEWTLAGIIQKVDTQNKFFEIRTAPPYPVSLEPLGFDDTVRIYFDPGLDVVHIVVETENGVAVKLRRSTWSDISRVPPGKPVRVVGEFSSDGTYLAKRLSVFDYSPQ